MSFRREQVPNTGYYKAVIVLDDGATKKKSPVSGSQKTDEEKYQQKWNNSLEKGITGLVSYSAISSTADRLISYEISQVELRTGAREMEQRMQTTYNFGKKIVNSAVALGAGLVTGNFPLVAIGLATSVFNSVISIAQKQQKIDTQQSVENVSINMQNERAGLQGRRGTIQ